MRVEQFYDKGLAHASYAIISRGKMAIIDPARDPKPYFELAESVPATIEAIIETHPHADFVSSHAEIAEKTGAKIYVSKLVGADYPHQPFDEGDEIKLGKITLKAINTPGHSPDSISIVLIDENGKDHSVFTGDTLFIGDVGRPDLREKAGNIQAKREQLAEQMYHSTREKLMMLPDETIVYPAHGAGSLCGKNLSSDLVSTIGREKRENYALQEMSRDEFVSLLLQDQPFIPKYFGYDVALNKKGADSFEESIKKVPRIDRNSKLEEGVLVVDTRPQVQFRNGHVKGAINIMDGGKFETWLGSIVGPDEKFYLIAENNETLESVIRKAAKIGYEKNIKGALLNPDDADELAPEIDPDQFANEMDRYTIVDVRNESEIRTEEIFKNTIRIPLPELRERVNEIPATKPVIVHCAGGYRSAAGASIILSALPKLEVFDLGEAIKYFKKR
jgi:hydroxyacylglutathione hydrolase